MLLDKDRKERRMNRNSILTAIALTFVIVGLLICQKVELSWVIVAIAITYGLRLVWKNGKNWWRKRDSSIAQRQRFLYFLISLMFLFLSTGTALYLSAFIAEFNEPTPDKSYYFVNAEYLLRSLVCSFQLFAANIDSNVLDSISNHYYLKGLISIQAGLSFSCTAAFLVGLAYSHVKEFIKLHKRTKVDNNHKNLYVFFGINEPSRLLAKSIRQKETDEAIIIFVENSNLVYSDQDSWNNILNMYTQPKQTFSVIDEINARVTFTETKLCDVEIKNNELVDVLEDINLIKLKDLIIQLSSIKDSKLHIFFLSENEDENIRAMSVMAMDKTINQIKEKLSHRFYCHARKNGLNRVIEDIAIKRGLEVRVIDSSSLCIELLKADKDNHPVKFIKTDGNNPTCVNSAESPFNAMIIGFDEAGQDSLRFLYEFGAFVDSDSTPENVARSAFHCIALDKRMDELKGFFSTTAPRALQQENKDGSKLVELVSCDCSSEKFYQDILNESRCKNLNYVVIVVGDDDWGMTLAIRVFNQIRKKREDLSNLRIYVRSYRSDKESHLQKIADYYNQGYNKDCKEEESFKTSAIIIPFGQSHRIYSYDMIIDDELTEKGKLFQKNYAHLKGEKLLWDDRRKLLTGAKKEQKQQDGTERLVDVPCDQRVISLDNIRSLRRKENQDLANAVHIETKMNLLINSLPKNYDWAGFYSRYFDDNNMPKREGCCNTISYPSLSPQENTIILNLARLEHLRWNASHEMLGYSPYSKNEQNPHYCDERIRRHNCLLPWQDLDKESQETTKAKGWEADYKAFDYCVVDTTLLSYKNNLLSLQSTKNVKP